MMPRYYLKYLGGQTKVSRYPRPLVPHKRMNVAGDYRLIFNYASISISTTAKYAAIGSIVYGSSFYNLVPFLTSLGLYDPIKKIVVPLCLSCFQVLQDSPFLKDLNEGGDTVPGVEYHYIVSK